MDLLYSIKDILEDYEISPFILRNYIWKEKVGVRRNNKVYLTKSELEEFLSKTELKDEEYRDEIYDIIKKHPSIKEEELHKYTKRISRTRCSSLLADMTSIPKYKDLYEDDNDGLFVKGYDKVVKEGLFN